MLKRFQDFCCQFLWIVLLWLPVRYSVMFIIHQKYVCQHRLALFGWAIIFSRKLKGDNIIICHHNIDLSPFRPIPPCLPKKLLCQMYILRISLQYGVYAWNNLFMNTIITEKLRFTCGHLVVTHTIRFHLF